MDVTSGKGRSSGAAKQRRRRRSQASCARWPRGSGRRWRRRTRPSMSCATARQRAPRASARRRLRAPAPSRVVRIAAHAEQLGEAAGLRRVRVDLALDPAALDDDDAVGDVEHEVEVLLDDDERQLVALAQARPGSRRSPARSTAGCLRTARRAAAATAPASARGRARGSAARRPTARRPCGRAARAAAAACRRRVRSPPARCRPSRRVHARRRFSSAVRPGQDAAPLRHVADAEPAAVVRLHPRDVDAVDRDAAGGRRHQADQRLQERGLADAVVADDADRLARLQLEVDAMQHRHMAVAGAQAGDVEDDVAARTRGVARRRVEARDSVSRSFGAAPDVDLAHLARRRAPRRPALRAGSRPGASP